MSRHLGPRAWSTGLGWVLALSLACDRPIAPEDGGAAPDAPPADVGPPDASPRGTGQVTMEIVRDGRPVVGAVASVDRPGGGRDDGVTGEDGRVTFGGLDWAAGPVAATAFDGRLAYGLVGFTEADVAAQPEPGVVRVEVVTGVGGDPPPPPSGVELLVTFANEREPATSFHAASPRRGEILGPMGEGVRLRVPAGEPVSLVGYEVGRPAPSARGIVHPVLGWARATLDAPTAGAILDFGVPATPVTVSTSIALPDGFVPQTRVTTESIRVLHPDCVGIPAEAYPTRVEYDAAYERLEVDLEHVLHEGATPASHVTWWHVDSSQGRRHSAELYVAGVPSEGPQPHAFMAIPRVTTPAAGVAARLHDPIALEVDRDADLIELGLGASGRPFGWYLRVGSAHDALRIPALPTGVDERAAVGADTLFGWVDSCDLDGATPMARCAREASLGGLDFTLE